MSNTPQADFSIALMQIKKGEKMTRASWPEGQYVELHEYEDGIDICLLLAAGRCTDGVPCLSRCWHLTGNRSSAGDHQDPSDGYAQHTTVL